MLKGEMQSTLQSSEIFGTYCSSWSGVNAGLSPSAVSPEAMVPPVPIIRIFFTAYGFSFAQATTGASRSAETTLSPRVIIR